MDFDSTIEEIDAVTKRLKITVPHKTLSAKWEQQVEQLTKTARLNGFRPGKAPRHMVERLHGDKIKWDIVQNLVTETLTGAVKKHELSTVGRPSIDLPETDQLFDGSGKNPFSYTADLAILPQPTIKNYEKFTVNVEKKKIGDEDVEKTIERMRDSRMKLEPVTDRANVKADDVLSLDVQAAVKGEEFSNPEPVMFDLAKDSSLPEKAKKKLLASKKGDAIEVDEKAKDDHAVAAFRGKEVSYRVVVKDISKKILPELNEEFWKSVGKSSEVSVEEFKLKLKEIISKESEQAAERDVKGEILKQLREKNDFKVPQVMIDEEIRGLFVRMGMVNPREVDLSTIDVAPYRESFSEVATNLVKDAIIMQRIREQEKLAASNEEIDAQLNKLAVEAGVDVAQVKEWYKDPRHQGRVTSELEHDKIWKLLLDRAKVTYKDKQDLGDSTPRAGKEKKE